MPDPAVSVIIPAYQSAQYVKAALDSVFEQSFKDYEVIVVNDGSPDTTELEAVLTPYRSRITYIRQENQGLAGARNAGIRAAHGRFMAPLDADDIWCPEHLESQVAVLEADPSIDVVYADARIFGNSNAAGKTVMDLCPSSGTVTFEALVTRRCTVHVCVSVCRISALQREGLFDATLRRGEDIDMWLRIAAGGGRIVYRKRVLGNYRRHAGSLSADPVPMHEAFAAVLAKVSRDPRLTLAQRQIAERQCVIERAAADLERGKRAFLAGDADGALAGLTRANEHFKSRKIAAILTLLRVAPRLLRAVYQWRSRRVLRLKTQP